MAFTYGFYNSVNHDRKYDAVQMGQIFDGIITDGIYATYLKAMVVKASSNASEVIVQPGRAWFNHTWSYNDADYPVAAPEPEVVLDRIDTLVLDINSEDASRTNSFLWVQGTPTSQVPEPPTLIHTVTHNQYPLCDVYRQAGTTQIYAADITNRVGTSDCPFVTGVLEGIDIDDLLAQWDNEFHTWENATKASFEGWMVNQQAVYTAWWDALKVQMAGDVADVEAWIATIHDILDEEVATRLQAEIDEIKTELPSGSHITVTTTDTELYSRTVTITDEANHTVTSQFDATGVAVFKTVPYVGNLTISSTDGTRTATAVVQTPYFARYSFSIAFWNATVNIDGTSELGGETVSITDSSLALVGTVVLNASGLGVFNATYPDTYKFSVTHGGETMSVTLEVSQETTYNVEIHGGFSWQRWVDLSENYNSSDFNDLDELLADQKAVRELMTIHACVDYMADATRAGANITQIINNDICAKWINLRDYALDTLYANSTIAAVMDTSDKYFYGELGIINVVPNMTSNTTPSGVASASSEFTHEGTTFSAYKAFVYSTDGTQRWQPTPNETNSHIDYQFTEKKIIREVSFHSYTNAFAGTYTGVIEASDDGVNWTSLSSISFTAIASGEEAWTFSFDNNIGYYRYRIRFNEVLSTAFNYYCSIRYLEFKAYAPKGAVPVMTGNTAPYGEAIRSSEPSSIYESYKVFDRNYSTFGGCANANNAYVGYKFTNPICPKKAKITEIAEFNSSCEYKIKGSNDGSTWDTLASVTSASQEVSIDTDNYYLYLALWQTYRNGAYSNSNLRELQFYGRQLSVSVPVMTSNTAPYGEAIILPSANSSSPAWRMFDKSLSTYSGVPDNTAYPHRFGYIFNNKDIVLKMITVQSISNHGEYNPKNCSLEYTEDGTTWEEASETFTLANSTALQAVPISGNSIKGKGFRIIATNGYYTTYNWSGIGELQFYGLDYSEKEFEAGTTKKWLYDHGVELETLIPYTVGTNTDAQTDYNDSLMVSLPASKQRSAAITSQQDLTSYSLLRGVCGDELVKQIGLIVSSTSSVSYLMQFVAKNNIQPANGNLPNNMYLDISAVTGNYYVGIFEAQNDGSELQKATAKELWLE